MAGIGHNNGPTMERGYAYRRHVWAKARANLLNTVPVEIVRMRVRRAKELGLDYKTYAGIRASTGRDVIGFLFSGNALRLRKMELDAVRAAKLEAVEGASKVALIYPPAHADQVQAANKILDAAFPAPKFTDSWSVMRDTVAAAIQSQHLPKDGVVVIGDTTLEREWADAGRTAGYLQSERYFGELG